jgi:hypothetical protein
MADVVEAMKGYARKYDADQTAMPNTRADCLVILMEVFGADCTTVGGIPADPLAYGQALTAVNRAIAGNPFKRIAVS